MRDNSHTTDWEPHASYSQWFLDSGANNQKETKCSDDEHAFGHFFLVLEAGFEFQSKQSVGAITRKC